MPRSKDKTSLEGLSIHVHSWSEPADSHFFHSFIHKKCIVFIINQAGQVKLQPGLIVGGWNLGGGGGGGGGCVIKSGMSGKRCEIKGLVSDPLVT